MLRSDILQTLLYSVKSRRQAWLSYPLSSLESLILLSAASVRIVRRLLAEIDRMGAALLFTYTAPVRMI